MFIIRLYVVHHGDLFRVVDNLTEVFIDGGDADAAVDVCIDSLVFPKE